MNRRSAFKRAFFGWYRTNGHQNDLTSLLPTEECVTAIVSQEQWGTDLSWEEGSTPDSGIVHCLAVLGPPSRKVKPARSWKQRWANYNFLRSGETWFMGKTWMSDFRPATMITRPDQGYIQVSNLSSCCFEPLILGPCTLFCDPAVSILSCSRCQKIHLGRFPNKIDPTPTVSLTRR